MPGPLVGRIIGIRAFLEEASVPGEVEDVAVKRAGQALPPGLLLDRSAEIDDAVAATLGQRGKIIDDILFGGRVAERVQPGFELAFGRWDDGRLERDRRAVPPGRLECGDVAAVAPAEPITEIAPHGLAVIAAELIHRRLALDPFAGVAGPDLIGDDPVEKPDLLEVADVRPEEPLGFVEPDPRGERHAVPPPVRKDLALAGMGFLPPVIVTRLQIDAEMEQGRRVGLDDASEARLDRREIKIARAPRPRPDPFDALADVERIDMNAGPRAFSGLSLEIPFIRGRAGDPVDRGEDGLAVEKEGRTAVVRADLGRGDAEAGRLVPGGRGDFGPKRPDASEGDGPSPRGRPRGRERRDLQDIPPFHVPPSFNAADGLSWRSPDPQPASAA